MSSIPELFDAWGPLGRQNIVVFPEGVVTDDAAGHVVLGSALRVMAGGGNDNWIKVAAGSHTLADLDALCVDLPPTNANGGTHAAYVDPYAAVVEQFPKRDRLVLGVRMAGGRVAWLSPPMDRATATAGAMTKIFDVTVGGGGASDPAAPAAVIDSNTILGGNIPGGGGSLLSIISARGDVAAGNVYFNMRVNNDSTVGNYQGQVLYGAASSPGAGDLSGAAYWYVGIMGGSAGVTAGDISTTTLTIPDYAGTIYHKGFVSNSCHMTGASAGDMRVFGGRYLSTAAVTRLALASLNAGGNFAAGTRWQLFRLA